jgi:hypothetical protein
MTLPIENLGDLVLRDPFPHSDPPNSVSEVSVFPSQGL